MHVQPGAREVGLRAGSRGEASGTLAPDLTLDEEQVAAQRWSGLIRVEVAGANLRDEVEDDVTLGVAHDV